MLTVVSVILGGWLFAATIGTWAYLAGENSSDAPQL